MAAYLKSNMLSLHVARAKGCRASAVRAGFVPQDHKHRGASTVISWYVWQRVYPFGAAAYPAETTWTEVQR